ncbi:MAG: Regulator of RpoS [Syntrophus sp. SKADARSKE-3]|nr:Regulator of RpoS [Syntrophus sp. SKADARSKE-3]
MKKVLYIEDSRVSQLIVQKFLGGFCETTAVSTISDARTSYAKDKFDLIITDFRMPEGTPWEFIQEVRRHVSPMELPILLVSSSLDSAMINTALAIGVNDGLSKSLEGKTFLDTVNRLLTSPYVRPVDESIFSINILEWTQEGRYHCFCPELRVTVEGANSAEANERIIQMALKSAAGGTSVKEVLNAKLASKTIKVK